MNERFPAGHSGHDVPSYHERSHPAPQHLDGFGVELVRLTHPRDVVTAVPYLLGFEPDPGSIVVLALREDRVEVTIRVTAPPPDEVPAVWGRLAKPLDDAGAEYVSVVGYLPAEQDGLLLAYAAAAPVPPVDVLRVHEGRWWSLTMTACMGRPDLLRRATRFDADPGPTFLLLHQDRALDRAPGAPGGQAVLQ